MRGRARPAPTLWEAAAQAERTCLSWQRTAIALAAVLLLLVRAGTGAVAPMVFAAGALALSHLLLSSGRYRSTARRLAAHRPLPGPAPLLTLAVLVTVTGTAALAVIAAGQPDGVR